MLGCAQNVNFFSPDNSIFLVVTATGNIVLYNGNYQNNYPSSPSAIIWQSATSSTTPPFYLTMQDVSVLSLIEWPWLPAMAHLATLAWTKLALTLRRLLARLRSCFDSAHAPVDMGACSCLQH